MTKPCADPECDRTDISGRGLCSKHYQRYRYRGTLDAVAPPPPPTSCVQCGVEIQSSRWDTLYCSRKCNDRARLRRDHPIRDSGACENCGASLAGRRSHARVCSERCGDAVRNARASAARWAETEATRKPCRGCAGQIPAARQRNAQYCSDECKIRSRRHEAYGLTKAELDILLAQHEQCAICDTTEWGKKGPQVDHCHATGRVRGILCTNCNQGLGRFGDDTKRLQRAIEYLER